MDGSKPQSLQATLDEQRAKGAARRNPEVEAAMEAQIKAIADRRLRESALKSGTNAPGFSLPDQNGQNVTLASLLAEGPVVLSFYRGGWCPYCNIELRALTQYMPQMQAYGARLVAISPELPEHGAETARENAVSFPVLSDVGNRVAREYRLVYSFVPELRTLYREWGVDLATINGDNQWELPLPATFVIARDGRIKAAFVEYDYTRRMEPEDILKALKI